jgi:hypothetical protein
LPVAVRDDGCALVLASGKDTPQYALVVGSLARQAGPFRVRIRTELTPEPECIPTESLNPSWAGHAEDTRACRSRLWIEDAPPASSTPPARKVFHVLTRAGGLDKAANYTAVSADLLAVGRFCQAYVDRAHPDPANLLPLVKDAVRAFDEEIYPRAAASVGTALDVDRDGRFTLLFTPSLSKLQNGGAPVEGFVRGGDFYRDGATPYSNRCDMMYLSTELRPGLHLRTILAHEYTHAVVFCAHVLVPQAAGAAPRAEESWLDEGLAHLAEEMHGYSWSNLDYRISAFLSCPERNPLVMADYYVSGRWRDPGTRGAAFLFLHWCRVVHGPDLQARLTQSRLTGIGNVEAATQAPFAVTFRRWSVALLEGNGWRDLRAGAAAPLGRLLCGPRFTDVALAGAEQEVQLAATAVSYFRLHGSAAGHTRVTVTADSGADLQVTLVPMPRTRLVLRVERNPERQARLVLTAYGGTVELQDAAWERLNPVGNAEDTSYRCTAIPSQTAPAWFGRHTLKDGETITSMPIPLPATSEPLVWKVLGKDSAGHTVAGWRLSEQ